MDKRVLLARKRKVLRERMRIHNVIAGLGAEMTVKEIHHKTGLIEKRIRKIMLENAEEITFLLLKREHK